MPDGEVYQRLLLQAGEFIVTSASGSPPPRACSKTCGRQAW
jgi:hypothetical protein